MSRCIKALLILFFLTIVGCGSAENVQMPDNPDPMPEHGPTSEGLEKAPRSAPMN